MRLRDIEDVAAWRMCTGCGACVYGCKDGSIRLVDVINDGLRPVIESKAGCANCRDCLKYCPGHEISHGPEREGTISSLEKGWGPVLEIWEGFATDPKFRFKGSSGGAASALALYCVERRAMSGVLHTGASHDEPWRNKTVLSTTRDDLLLATGSRYSPASPCDGLKEIEKAPSPCVFVGKPCDVAALKKSQAQRPGLDARTGLAIAVFCAGTPSTLATLELMKKYGVETADVRALRYRGNGWPGRFEMSLSGGAVRKLDYSESWGFLQSYRPFRCHLCPDGTGELADISCGDPWHRQARGGEQGRSLVIVRTKRGREIVRGAMEEGYIDLKRAGPRELIRSQPNLLEKRKAVWGRILALRLFLIPAPRLRGFRLFGNWLELGAREKLKSVLGTLKRALRRNYLKKSEYLKNPTYL